MKCNNCGFENAQGTTYCVNCGAAMPQYSEPVAETISLNPASDVILPALRDKLFYVLCIMMTISTGMSVLTGGISVINVLLTIFLWLTYTDAVKGFANPSHLQVISGTVYASYIITNVLSVLLIVCGPLFILAYDSVIKQDVAIYKEILNIIAEATGTSDYKISTKELEYVFYAIGIALCIAGIISLVFNILCMRKIHRFAKSVYTAIMNQTLNFYKPMTIRNWFVFLAVCGGLSTFSTLSYGIILAIPSICSTAVLIIVVMLINKYFPKYQ